MAPYNFWQDFFDTYQSLTDWIKALWLIVPSGFVLGLIALLMRPRTGRKAAKQIGNGELIYSIHRDAEDQLHVISYPPSHRRASGLILLERPLNDSQIRESDHRA